MGRRHLILLFFTAQVFSLNAFSSSCCGSSPSSFLINFSDERFILSIGSSYLNTAGRVFESNNEFIDWNSKKRSSVTNSLSSLIKFSDRLSLSAKLSFITAEYKDSFSNPKDSNFSDSLFSLNYEVLPLYTYSKYRPVIYLSFLTNLPTGSSIYESSVLPEGANVTGYNQFGLGAGLSFYKVLRPYTFISQIKYLNLFKDRIHKTEVSDFFDFSWSNQISYKLKKGFSLLVGLNWQYLSKREMVVFQKKSQDLNAKSTQVTSATFGFSYKLPRDFALHFTYLDQSLLGQPRNTLINRTYAINLTKSFL